MKQYILTPNASKIDALGLFGTTFSINGKDSRTASDSAIPADGYLNDQRYNGGDVYLDTSAEYSQFTRQTICETNNFTFVNTIGESGSMPRVGYKGDCLTSVASHSTQNYNKGQGYNPNQSIAFNGVMNGYRQGVTSLAKSHTLNENLAAPAFPYIQNLNVNRTQANAVQVLF